MLYGIEVTAPPTVLPVTIEQAKHQLRLDSDANTDDLQFLLEGAVQEAELETSRAFITQSIRLTLPVMHDRIQLPRGHVQSVTGAGYEYTDLTTTTIAPTDILLDNSRVPARICPVDKWPDSDPDKIFYRAYVDYVAGYGDSDEDIPIGLQMGILMLLAHRYEYRGDSQSDAKPENALRMLNKYRTGDIYHEFASDAGV